MPGQKPLPKVPAYRQRTGYSQAIVTFTDSATKKRRDYWLGEFGTSESRERYHRLVAAWEANERRLPAVETDAAPTTNDEQMSVVELVAAYWRWAESYYQPKHAQALKGALALIRQYHGRTPASEFGPNKLRVLRDEMVRGAPPGRKPWSRKYINSQVQRIRHMFKWAAARELVPAVVHQALCSLEALRRGRSNARENPKVLPVPEAILDAVLPHLTRPVRAAVQLQLLTGARPGEILSLRPCDIEFDYSSDIWAFRPEHHKNAYRERERIILFGPRAQEVIRSLLPNRATTDLLFSPEEAVTECRESRRVKRTTPLSCGNRPGTNRTVSPRRKAGHSFTTNSYNRSVQYACDRPFPLPFELARIDGETVLKWESRLKAEALWHRSQRGGDRIDFM